MRPRRRHQGRGRDVVVLVNWLRAPTSRFSPRVFHRAAIVLDDGRLAPLGSWRRPKKTTAPTSHPPTFTIGSLV